MKNRIVPASISGLSLLCSASVSAHIGHADAGASASLVHLMTGAHHAPLLILVAAAVYYMIRKNRRADR